MQSCCLMLDCVDSSLLAVYCKRKTNVFGSVNASAELYKHKATLNFPLSERKLTTMGLLYLVIKEILNPLLTFPILFFLLCYSH